MSIEVKNLSFSYGEHEVLHDVSFSVAAGEYLSILGPNGVGKSTLFRCVLGLLAGLHGQRHRRGAGRQIPEHPRGRSAHRLHPPELAPGLQLQRARHRAHGHDERARHLRHAEEGGCQEGGRGPGEDRHTPARRSAASTASPAASGSWPSSPAPSSSARPSSCWTSRRRASTSATSCWCLGCARELAREGYTVIQTTHNPEQSFMFSDRILALRGGRVLTEGGPKGGAHAGAHARALRRRGRGVEPVRGQGAGSAPRPPSPGGNESAFHSVIYKSGGDPNEEKNLCTAAGPVPPGRAAVRLRPGRARGERTARGGEPRSHRARRGGEPDARDPRVHGLRRAGR